MQDVVVIRKQGLLHCLDGDAMKLSFAITPIYITGSVPFILSLHLWIGRALIIHHDVCIFLVFEEVPNSIVEETILAHI